MIAFEPPCTPNNFQVRHLYSVIESDAPSFARQINPRESRLVQVDFETTDESTAAYCRGLWRQSSGGVESIELSSPLEVTGRFVMTSPPRVSHRHAAWTVTLELEEIPA